MSVNIMGNSIVFRKAVSGDLPDITRIYDDIHTREENGLTTIGWRRGIYPTGETAEAALRRGELYVAEESCVTVACAIINREQHPGYAAGDWIYPAKPEEVLVLHTLVVNPSCQGRGIGPQFIHFYEKLAKRENMRALRMDTNVSNCQARGLYARLGFREAGSIQVKFNGLSDVSLVLLEKPVS